jgi:asparagine N-glycosylation enzyme membrane subunit Stt3
MKQERKSGKIVSNKITYSILFLTIALTFVIQHWINQSVKERYIDEYFHIRMTEKYLKEHNFTYWDPKITTPPGLYLKGYSFGKALQKILPWEVHFEGDQILYLRYLNR